MINYYDIMLGKKKSNEKHWDLADKIYSNGQMKQHQIQCDEKDHVQSHLTLHVPNVYLTN